MTEAEKLVEDVAASMFEDMQRRRYEGRMPSPWPPMREIAEEWRCHARSAITRLTAPAAVDVAARDAAKAAAKAIYYANSDCLCEADCEEIEGIILKAFAPPHADEVKP